MRYSKEKFARELKQEIRNGFDVSRISQWAYMLSIDRHREISPELDRLIQIVAVMDEGPEFEFSEDELVQFANDLEIS
ncbi:hypothetical protein KR51_00037270 [Rubidibacter lacunae KORDI 51-2]|uniref:Uncharacterized protein n=1 Tax=Rubidibacter lacunae KORDI 51-2 TaxID=582515 RepID=U5D553_9CHRO|nr:hypothetical protein [Rubidibacter lacunae]ERN39813.1 hypothetical protein KR51_00037270 [Rubidibacter lacunae KORDI 51-2]